MHHLHDAELDSMIEKARLETDQAKRMAMSADIQTRIVALHPAIFGMLEDRRWALRTYVKGFQYCPMRATRRGRSLHALCGEDVILEYSAMPSPLCHREARGAEATPLLTSQGNRLLDGRLFS